MNTPATPYDYRSAYAFVSMHRTGYTVELRMTHGDGSASRTDSVIATDLKPEDVIALVDQITPACHARVIYSTDRMAAMYRFPYGNLAAESLINKAVGILDQLLANQSKAELLQFVGPAEDQPGPEKGE